MFNWRSIFKHDDRWIKQKKEDKCGTRETMSSTDLLVFRNKEVIIKNRANWMMVMTYNLRMSFVDL